MASHEDHRDFRVEEGASAFPGSRMLLVLMGSDVCPSAEAAAHIRNSSDAIHGFGTRFHDTSAILPARPPRTPGNDLRAACYAPAMHPPNRRFLPQVVGASAMVFGILFLWLASRWSSATGDLFLTGAKLEDLVAQGADLTISMDDIQGLWGGHSLEVRLDGRVSGPSVRRPAAGESGMQTRRLEGQIDPARARALIERCVNDGALEARRRRDVGVPDEVVVRLSIRSTTGGVTSERANWLFAHELDSHENFRAAYEAMKTMTREIAGER